MFRGEQLISYLRVVLERVPKDRRRDLNLQQSPRTL